ncbi:hypothetical protein SteCoe_19352 [Stentor coeruleus]|uniref:DUF4201 domain-containing protein n=1 Tax=Stentor coeruleus TaxID=5963 RepID=A0A1R2BU99_9CILI|nr:hypothetical protein SteCoe_19352 [Stentor coeruleus]
MVDLDDAKLHTSRMSMFSSIQQSFCENYEEFDEDDDNICAEEVPEYFLDKFQDLLTEIDRLNMRIEDFCAEKCRRPETNIDIYLNKDQIKSLHDNLGNLLSETNQNTIFKLNNESLSIGAIKIEYDDTVERIRQLEIENINLRSQMLSSTIKKPRNSPSEFSEYSKLVSMKIELEMKSLEITRKEQELQQSQEEFICKNSQAEMLIHEYNSKLEELKNNNTHQNRILRKNPSQDVTRTRSPISILYPNSISFMNELLNTRQEIEAKLAIIEKVIKKKYKKKTLQAPKGKLRQASGNFEEFKAREQKFLEKLKKYQSFPSKEKFIMKYLMEQQEFLNEKYEELRKYEISLQDTWIGSNEQPNAIDAAKKASACYYNKINELKRSREIVEEKYLKLNKLKETIKKGNIKLQENRRKVINERQKLQKEISDLEKYFRVISNLHNKNL